MPEGSNSWSLSVDVERVPSDKTDLEMGVEQVKRLCQTRGQRDDGLDIVVADAKYGNHHFMEALKDQPCPEIPGWYGKVVRLRKDRVLYHPAPAPSPGKRGRPRKHGPRFAFKETETWGQPTEFVSLRHPHWGSIEIRRWNDLHARESTDIEFDVVQVRVHLEKGDPPSPLWLA